jgi:stage V sporulation protein G
MEITDVKITPFDTGTGYGRIRAYAAVTLDGVLTILGIKVMESDTGGLFLAYPSIKGRSASYHDVVEVLDKELERRIRDRVVTEYREQISGKEQR